MTLSDDSDLDELLGLIDRVGPVPAEFQERLHADLRTSLAAGPVNSIDDREPADLIELEPDVAHREMRAVPQGLWLGAAVLVVLLVLGVISTRSEPLVDPVAERPPTAAATSTPVETYPILDNLGAACARFADLAPDRTVITELVTSRDAEAGVALDDLVDAVDVLFIDLESSALVDQSGLQLAALARGFLDEAAALANDGADASAPFRRADDLLGNLAAGVPEFTVCRAH